MAMLQKDNRLNISDIQAVDDNQGEERDSTPQRYDHQRFEKRKLAEFQRVN